MDFLNLDNQKNLIDDVILYPLKVNRDPRGILVETLKTSWEKIYGPDRPFTQNYYSITNPGFARDEDSWHVHKMQEDRFIVITGSVVVALCDQRKGKKSFGKINLIRLGDKNGDEGQFLLLIPKEVLHAHCAVGEKPGLLLNFPTRLHNPSDEGRVPFAKAQVHFADGTLFSWKKVRQAFKEEYG